MGKATRWLKGIFGIKNNTTKDHQQNPSSGDRKRPSFGDSGRDSSAGVRAPEAPWLKSYYADSEKDQSKHAIAVAAATAAAADAAVAAAQAAVAVVRLTSHGRGNVIHAASGGGGGGGGTEKWAAVKIQTTFRGYLARKALRALKGLVKIQALVRGYLVRKQATATLHGMQALIRAQATVRSKRTQAQAQAQSPYFSHHQDFRARRSMEMFDDTRSEQGAASSHSRRLSASFDQSRTIHPITEDMPPKIVEVDPGRPRSSRAWRPNSGPGPLPDHYGGDHDPFYPPRLSIPMPAWHHDQDQWGPLAGDECCRYPSTAHSTPRFANPGPVTPSKSVCGDHHHGYFYTRPHLPAHHQYVMSGPIGPEYDGGGTHHQHPNYMANTQSFRAKVRRSQSAPKQRPEPGSGPGSRKRLTLTEMMEARSSLSGVKMQRSCSQVQEAINFKNAIMGKLERSYDFQRN